MFSALFSFLGGGVFRMLLGEVSTWLTKRQDHSYEIERMRVQGDLEAAQHGRNLEAIRVQAELGVQTIRVQGEADLSRIDASGFYETVREAQRPTGILVVDMWNGVIRPAAATIALVLWVLALNEAGWKMGEWDKELVCVIMGFYFVSRQLAKAGK